MSSRFHRLTKPLRRGWGLWRVWGAPKAFHQKAGKHGYVNYAVMKLGQRQMERAAASLPPAAPEALTDPVEVHFLTGRGHWYLTAFCARSLLHHTPGEHVRPVIHDDGTLERDHIDALRRILPVATIMGREQTVEQLDGFLPATRFPVLREQHFQFPMFRKFHLHAAAPGWKLYVDSDVLFHRQPDRLLEWLRQPEHPCYLLDTPGDWYGYPSALLQSLVAGRIPASVNAGLVGLNREQVDWERLEYWARTLVERVDVKFHLEQALTAMLLAGTPADPLPREQYIVAPNREEVLHPDAVMHHYTDTARAWYYRFAWRRALRELSGIAGERRPWIAGLSLAVSLSTSDILSVMESLSAWA